MIQQSICAIEFIGETLQAGTVESIRVARDELLLPTEKGRGWIELVTSVQAELLGTVLSDKALTKRAISLLSRATDQRKRHALEQLVHYSKKAEKSADSQPICHKIVTMKERKVG